MHRTFVILTFTTAAFAQQQKEVSGGYHVDHPDKPLATPTSTEKPGAKTTAKKKLHSNAKKTPRKT